MKKIVLRKGKRRYKTEAQIIAKIDDCHTRSKQLRIEAERQDRVAEQVILAAAEKDENAQRIAVAGARTLRREANLLRVKATRLIEVRAKNLGDRLSEFRTMLLPNSGVTDESVPAL